jgi:hypothetical protein
MDDLNGIESERWTVCAFDEFLSDPKGTIGRLQNFCELDADTALENYCATPLPQSRYTQTAPKKGKWKQHQAAITEIFPSLIATINRINTSAAEAWRLDTNIPPVTAMPDEGKQPKLGRNDLCHCGSGRKYKLCHGQIA